MCPLVFLVVCATVSFLFDFSRASEEEKPVDKVIINEIAWMGTKENYNNEWIELFNNSEEDLSLESLVIENEDSDLEIELEGEIEPKEFFLLERTDNESVPGVTCDQTYTGALGNEGENLFLRDVNSEEILDKAVFAKDGWSAGDNDSKRTMERNSEGDWQTSANPGGTPKEKNSGGFEDEEEQVGKDISCNLEDNPQIEGVFINEIYPNPDPESKKKENQIEWIELFNSGQEEVSLQGCCLTDENAFSNENKDLNDYFCFDSDAKIKSEDYLKVNQEEVNFVLNDGEETVYFLAEEEVVLDKKKYANPIEGHSYALNEKGEWKWTPKQTPKSKNKFPEPAECPDNLVISEIFPNPEENETENEWVEIHNPGEKKVSLEGCYLADENLLRKKEVKEYFSFSEKDEVKAEDYLVVKRDRFGFGMNNGDEKVSLRNSQNEEISGVEYDGSKEGSSYALDKENNWKWTKILTPKEDNRFPRPKKYSEKIRINEFLPNPEGIDKEKEWIEFVNLDNKKVDLADWEIKNQSGQSFKIEKLSLDPEEIKVLKLKETSFSIRNSGGWLSLDNPNEKQVDKVEYPDPSPPGSSWNKNKKDDWSWSHFTTPGKENKPNHPPEFEIDKPEKIYENIRTYFKLKNLEDADGDELKFRWEFGDGRKSYQKETSHIYKEEDEYLVRVRVGDPSVDVFKEFEVDVKEYPDYEIEIVKLLPNPVGRDSEGEKIWIKNKSEEDVNLRGWSVATGKNEDNLFNHPIRENFEIKAGEVKALQRKNCAFSLLNKKATVTLRYPDGDKAHQVKYEKDAVEEDEFYEMESESGEWIWVLPIKNRIVKRRDLDQKKSKKKSPP